jgi:hypothetical protein
MDIDLHSELSFHNSFRFPLQNRLARKELALGALWVLVPFLGWLLNLGHRIEMVHNMHAGRQAWPAWVSYPRLLKSGIITFLGMMYYYAPGLLALYFAVSRHKTFMYAIAVLLLVLSTVAIPGYMTHYCRDYDAREIFNPFRALRRVSQGGREYWKAWAITLTALAISFLGLLLAGVGFLFTSVWFWQVAGFSFASVFSHRFALIEKG